MASGDTLKLQVNYGDMLRIGIRTEVNYSALPSSADKVMYPLALCRKLAGKGLGNVPETDAVIHINSNAQWCVGQVVTPLRALRILPMPCLGPWLLPWASARAF